MFQAGEIWEDENKIRYGILKVKPSIPGQFRLKVLNLKEQIIINNFPSYELKTLIFPLKVK